MGVIVLWRAGEGVAPLWRALCAIPAGVRGRAGAIPRYAGDAAITEGVAVLWWPVAGILARVPARVWIGRRSWWPCAWLWGLGTRRSGGRGGRGRSSGGCGGPSGDAGVWAG